MASKARLLRHYREIVHAIEALNVRSPCADHFLRSGVSIESNRVVNGIVFCDDVQVFCNRIVRSYDSSRGRPSFLPARTLIHSRFPVTGVIIAERHTGQFADGLAICNRPGTLNVSVAIAEIDRPGSRLTGFGREEAHRTTYHRALCHGVARIVQQDDILRKLDSVIIEHVANGLVTIDDIINVLRNLVLFIGNPAEIDLDFIGFVVAYGSRSDLTHRLGFRLRCDYGGLLRQHVHGHEVHQHQQRENPCQYALLRHFFCSSLWSGIIDTVTDLCHALKGETGIFLWRRNRFVPAATVCPEGPFLS